MIKMRKSDSKLYIAVVVIILFVCVFAFLLFNIRRAYNGFEEVDISAYAYDVPDTVNYYIDYIEHRATHTYIYGWINNSSPHFSYPTVILYDTNAKTYHKLVTTSVKRSDLVETYGSEYENSGFVATVDNKYLTSEYQIMLTYPCTDKELLVTTDHYFSLEESTND